MLSLELFAGLLSKLPANCSLVLVGDPNQLSSVGTGNLIPELLELGCPVTRLERQYRQSDNESALFYNVVNYPKLSDSEELRFDDSFQLIPASEGDIFKVIQEEAVKRYLAGENVQVIATTRADVKKLNEALQQVVNPPAEGKAEVTHNGITVRENDQTMILKNNREERAASTATLARRMLSRWRAAARLFTFRSPRTASLSSSVPKLGAYSRWLMR